MHRLTIRSFWLRLAIVTVTGAAMLAASGCTVFFNARRSQCHEPRLFNWKRDAGVSRSMYAGWAENAWHEIAASGPPFQSENYAWGFHDGFIDYCYAGGTGEPPAVPPRQFWNAEWRTGDGKIAADEWFAGYRHGAQIARDEGYRDQAVARSSVLSAGNFDSSASSCSLADPQDFEGEALWDLPMPPSEQIETPIPEPRDSEQATEPPQAPEEETPEAIPDPAPDPVETDEAEEPADPLEEFEEPFIDGRAGEPRLPPLTRFHQAPAHSDVVLASDEVTVDDNGHRWRRPTLPATHDQPSTSEKSHRNSRAASRASR